MRQHGNLAVAADRRIDVPMNLNRMPTLSAGFVDKTDVAGLYRALALAVPVSALMWLLLGFVIASLVR